MSDGKGYTESLSVWQEEALRQLQECKRRDALFERVTDEMAGAFNALKELEKGLGFKGSREGLERYCKLKKRLDSQRWERMFKWAGASLKSKMLDEIAFAELNGHGDLKARRTPQVEEGIRRRWERRAIERAAGAGLKRERARL